jgi:hypothetical protein
MLWIIFAMATIIKNINVWPVLCNVGGNLIEDVWETRSSRRKLTDVRSVKIV